MLRLSAVLKPLLIACILVALGGVAGVAFFTFVGRRQEVVSTMKQSTLSIGTGTIIVDIAHTAAELTKGLSGRTRLGEKEGMLFIFDRDGRPGIWMKDMNFPLDIIWLDSQKHVVYLVRTARPESYPAVFTPPTDARYVLEVPTGSVTRWGVNMGDPVRF